MISESEISMVALGIYTLYNELSKLFLKKNIEATADLKYPKKPL